LAKLDKATKRSASNDKSSSSDDSVRSVKVVERIGKKKPKENKSSSSDDESAESGATVPMERMTLGIAPEDISETN